MAGMKSIGIYLGVGAALAGVAYFVSTAAQNANKAVLESVDDAGAEHDPKKPKVTGFTYDWELAKSRLSAIGRVVTRYREKQSLKPETEWKSVTDAGLPVTLYSIMKPNSFPTERDSQEAKDAAFTNLYMSSRGPRPYRDLKGNIIERKLTAEDNKRGGDSGGMAGPTPATDFHLLGWPDVLSQQQIDAAVAKRGMAMPIILDMNMYSHAEQKEKTPRKLLVLRLNGKVEEIEAVPMDFVDIVTNK